MPKELTSAYIAGIIDGEGSITIYRREHGKYIDWNVRVIVGMTDNRIINLLQEKYGGSIWIQRRNEKWKEIYIWYLTGKKVESFLSEILPYLVIKEQQARIALELRELINDRKIARKGVKGILPFIEKEMEHRENLKEQMNLLNKRGYCATRT